MIKLIRSFVLLTLLTLVLRPAGAAIYLKFTPVIKGDSVVSGYTDQIEVNSFQMGVGVTIATGAGGQQASKPNVSEITVSKYLEKSSPTLVLDLNQGTKLTDATFSFVTTGGGGSPLLYYTVFLEDVFVTGYSVSSGGDRPSESLSLHFGKIHWTYYPVAGSTANPETSGWDYVANVKL